MYTIQQFVWIVFGVLPGSIILLTVRFRFGFGKILCKEFSFDKFMIRICHYKFSGNDKMLAKQNSCHLNIENSNPVECFCKYYVGWKPIGSSCLALLYYYNRVFELSVNREIKYFLFSAALLMGWLFFIVIPHEVYFIVNRFK